MSRARRILPLLLVLAFALFGFGCGDDPERGQLLLAIETDMAVPKDIDKVIVDVSTPKGVAHFERMLDGTDNTLPGTLAIVVGTEPDVAFTVTVIGVLGDIPRVMRQVSTALPKDGVHVLRVQLEWLCANKGSNAEWVGIDAEGTVKSTCEAKRGTCVMGLCQPLAFTPPNGLTELGVSEYAPGKTRTCFDAVSCLAAPHEETVTLSGGSCFFEQPAGLDLSRSNFNVAVKVPAGSSDGFCGVEGCVIPLDYDPVGTGAGWWAERLRVYVPMAICDRVPTRAALTVVWSTTCAPKSGTVEVCQNGMAPIETPDADAGVLADASPDARSDAGDSAFDARGDGDARTPDATDARGSSDALDAARDRSLDAMEDVSTPPPPDAALPDAGADPTADVTVIPDVSVVPVDDGGRDANPADAGPPGSDAVDATSEPPSPPADVQDARVVPDAAAPPDAGAIDAGVDAAPDLPAVPDAGADPADGEADDGAAEAAPPLF